MPHTLATYIALPGTTGEAMEHWHEVFGGDLQILRYGDMPPMEGMPFTPDPKSVAHSTLVLPEGAGVIAGGDAMDDGTDYPVRGSAYSLLYTTDTPDEARGLIQKLVDGGGSVGMPFEQAPWGDWYGQVFDRYGVMWSFSCESA
ncbi:VOC family protein [Leucobacter chironomi]|uniref:VOC family protein n=1 Tax=Leucobacter chironomi TaxID=491918 RepID=UPI0004252635|nr:VOC family protein [Leucobacter chironomi]